MKEMTLRIDGIRGLSFGAGMIEEDSYDDIDDVKEFPFDFTSSTVCGPLKDWCSDSEFTVLADGQSIQIPVANLPAFSTNKEIDKSGLFTVEQATHVKKTVKFGINDYYQSWRAGQSNGSGNGELLEAHEAGKGTMTINLWYEGVFDESKLFLILADTLPEKESVIAVAGYINPDGSISSDGFEYDDYRFTYEDVLINGESIVF